MNLQELKQKPAEELLAYAEDLGIENASVLRKQDLAGVGFSEEMGVWENDPDMMKIDPFLTDGAYYGPSRGHLFPDWARRIGMRHAWIYPVLTFTVALGFAFPLFLFMRERHLAARP